VTSNLLIPAAMNVLFPDGLIPLLTQRLESKDDFERVISAANLWRISRSEDAFVVLRREATREGSPMAEMAAGYLGTGE
jgi:hypothetical protein